MNNCNDKDQNALMRDLNKVFVDLKKVYPKGRPSSVWEILFSPPKRPRPK